MRTGSRLAAMKLLATTVETRPRKLPAAEIAAHWMNARARHAAERERSWRSQRHRHNEARRDRPPSVSRLHHCPSS
jgi:hypothetical protein